jgi:uncharacterized protein YjbI with pentapeptide repeats
VANKHARTKTPIIDGPHLSGLTPGNPDSDLAKNADLESLRYDDLTLSHLDLSGARLDEVQFNRVTADEVDLKGARLSDVALDQVGFTVARAARSQWRDVSVTGRLGSFEAYEAQWRSVQFVGCKLSFVNLRGAELHDVQFADCIIEELDLMGATANRVRFVNSQVASLNVQGAKLRDFDLRGAVVASIDGLVDLRGATLNPSQLSSMGPLFAEHFGLKIED